MSQSRRMSLVESLVNIAAGYGIALVAQMMILPLFGIHIPASQHAMISALFTMVSLVRSYTLRRFFNWVGVNQNARTE